MVIDIPLGAKGVDVSRHQNEAQPNQHMDWQALLAAGKKFVFIRATLGTTGIDPYFVLNWRAARAAGILTGAYHYLIHNLDGRKQADNFLKVLGGDMGELPPVLDLEPRAADKGLINPSVCLLNAMAWLERVEAVSGKRPLVYTNSAALSQMVTNRKPLAEYPLWMAAYTAYTQAGILPPATPPWSGYVCWQYSGDGRVPGVAGAIDLNLWMTAD